ncbi:unnamed protein product [Prorocentrum cordatum]|uniref:Uncharacterized protein n=1 Tax=Prorocentrum cordatum TaxID=2364126 RepID=A0ABN9X3U3_9DINO|nr:unnamed protein product [Polarella glacialis]
MLLARPDGLIVQVGGPCAGTSIDVGAVRFFQDRGISLADEVSLHVLDVAGTRIVNLQGSLRQKEFRGCCRAALAKLPVSCRPPGSLVFITAGDGPGAFNMIGLTPHTGSSEHGHGGELHWRDSFWRRDKLNMSGVTFEVDPAVLSVVHQVRTGEEAAAGRQFRFRYLRDACTGEGQAVATRDSPPRWFQRKQEVGARNQPLFPRSWEAPLAGVTGPSVHAGGHGGDDGEGCSRARGLQRHGGLGLGLVLRAGRFQCDQALHSTVVDETRKWRECGSCNGMSVWSYGGNADGITESCEGRGATADWDQSWCYVQGGSNCNQAPDSTVVGETRKWSERGPCNCMREWDYDCDADGVMESYEGRSQALDSTLVGETRKWREFGSCNGTTEWNYDGNAVGGMESYEGCSATANWDQSWCYVQDGSKCNLYLYSTVVGESRKWFECGSSNGMTEWNYDGAAGRAMESYASCSAAADWDQCYGVALGLQRHGRLGPARVLHAGRLHCYQALGSTVVGETRKCREHGSRSGMTEWLFGGGADGVMESHKGRCATADWDQYWCYVQGGSYWSHALVSTVIVSRMLGPRQSVSHGPWWEVTAVAAAELEHEARSNCTLIDLLKMGVPEADVTEPYAWVVPLGSNCLAATWLQSNGLRKFALPFDWTFSSPAVVSDCLFDDFRAYLDHREYLPLGRRGAGCGHRRYFEEGACHRSDVFLHHDPARKRKDYEYLQRCVLRFREVAQRPGRKLLLLCHAVDSPEALAQLDGLAQDSHCSGASWQNGSVGQVRALHRALCEYGVQNFHLAVVRLCVGAASRVTGTPEISSDVVHGLEMRHETFAVSEVHLALALAAEVDLLRLFDDSRNDEIFAKQCSAEAS